MDITNYLKCSILASLQQCINLKDNLEYDIINNANDFKKGCLSKDIFIKLKSLQNKKKKEEKLDDLEFDENTKNIDVIILARTIKTEYIDMDKYNQNIEELMGIYLVPAKLGYDGKLYFSQNKVPWFPREYLYPMIDEQISVGKMSDADDFLSSYLGEKNNIQTWDDYYKYIKNFYEYVTKNDFDTYDIVKDNHRIELENRMYIINDESLFTTSGVLNLYKDILENDIHMPLYEKMIDINKNKDKTRFIEESVESRGYHCGQMNHQYSLSITQRDCINQFNQLRHEDLLTISGPPGTGKTTLIQSVVADMYVHHALQELEPPLIVASSTNNQAVTNIIDSFGNIHSMGKSILDQHWIDDIRSFAIYFPSHTKKNINKAKENNYQYIVDDDHTFLQKLWTHKDEYKINFLLKAKTYFHRNFVTIQECQNTIHNELKKLDLLKNDLLMKTNEVYKLISGDNIPQYLRELENKLNEMKLDINNFDIKKKKKLEKKTKYSMRINEWYAFEKNQIPILLKILNPFFKCIKNKYLMRIQENVSSEEQEFIKYSWNIIDITTYYQKKIEDMESEITIIINSINQTKKKYDLIVQEKLQIENKLKTILDIFDQLDKTYHFLYVDEQRKNQLNKITKDFDFDEINNQIDVRVRYAEFWLAIHYYESKWLLLNEKLTQKQLESNINEVIQKKYHQISLLIPCIVCTLFVLPRKFRVFDNNERKSLYLYNHIDLLIIDEAGQVSPEIGLASFSLAKKALVIGDIKQIPPIWSTSRVLDVTFALKNKLINNASDFDSLISKGLSVSQLSLMDLAISRCEYGRDNEGLLLREHQRCYNEIINYCNHLIYDGKLLPYRGSYMNSQSWYLKETVCFGHKNILTRNSEIVNTSRRNKEEAYQIVKWLKCNYQKIVQSYKLKEDMDIKDILAIITPFKIQAAFIRKLINEELKDFSDYIEVGTVHIFQGGEKKVIIFSPVYGNDESFGFINKNDCLMNVAVSRAKDAFWIFGNFDAMCSAEKNTPIGLLSLYDLGEIVDIEI